MKGRQKTAGLLVVFFIALATIFCFYYYYESKNIKKPKLAFVGGETQGIRPFAFANQLGDTVTNAVMKDKVVVVEYFFTTCKGICPKMNENMAKVYQAFKGDNEVLILSHTVDPQRDSVAALKAYSLRFDADPKKWMFLTGSKQELYDQAYYSYLVTAVEEREENIDEDFIHTEKFVLIDKKGRLRVRLDKDGVAAAYDGTNEKSVAQLIEDIKYLQTETD